MILKNLGFTYTLSVNEKATQANLDKFIKKTLGGKDGLKIPIQLDVKSSLNLDQLKDIQKKINSTYKGKLNLNVKLKLDTDSISQTVLRNAQAKLNEQANRLFLNVDLKLSEQTMAKFGASLAIFKEVNRELEDMQKRLGSFNKKININIGTISGQETYKDIEQSMSNIEGMTKDVNLSLQSQLDLHTKTLNTLKETLKTKAQEIDLAKAELEATKETNKLKENHKSTSKEINEKITALSKELNANKKIVDTYNKQKEALDKQAKTQKEVTDITEQSQKRISELQAQQNDIQKSADLAKEESTRHQNNIDMTEAEIKVLKEKIKAMKEVKEEADTVISSKPTTKKQTAKQSETNNTISNVKKVAEVATDTAKEVAKELNEVVKEEAKVAEQTVVAQEKVVESKAKANKEEQKANEEIVKGKKKQNEITDAINTDNIQIMTTTKEMSNYEKEVYKNLVDQRGVLGDLKLGKKELEKYDEESIQRQKQYLQLLEKELSLVLQVVGNTAGYEGSKSNVTGKDGTLKRYGIQSKEDFEKLSEENKQKVLNSEAHMTVENVKYKYTRKLLAEIKKLREKGITDTELTNDLLDQQNEKLEKHKENRQAINEVQAENKAKKLLYPDAKSYVTEEMFGFTPEQLEALIDEYEEKLVFTRKGKEYLVDTNTIETLDTQINKLKESLKDTKDKDVLTTTEEKINRLTKIQTNFKELLNTVTQLDTIYENSIGFTVKKEGEDSIVSTLSDQVVAMKEYCKQIDLYVVKQNLLATGTHETRAEFGFLLKEIDRLRISGSSEEGLWTNVYEKMKNIQKTFKITDDELSSFYEKHNQQVQEAKVQEKALQEQRERDLVQMKNYKDILSEQVKSFEKQSDMYKKCQDALAKYRKAAQSSTSDLAPILALMQKVSTQAGEKIEYKNSFNNFFAKLKNGEIKADTTPNISVKSNIEPVKVEKEFKSVAEKASEYLEDARKRLDKVHELQDKADKLEQEEMHLYIRGTKEAHAKAREELKETESEINKLLKSVNLEMKEAFKQIRDNMTEEQLAKYNVADLDLKSTMMIAEQEVMKHFREREGGKPLTPAIMKKMVEDANIHSDSLDRAKNRRKELINEGKRKKDGVRYSSTQEYKDSMDLSQKSIDRAYNEIYKTIANIARRFEEAMAIAYDNVKAKEQQAKVEAQQPVKTETPIKVEAPVEVKPIKTEISKEEQTQSEEITKAKEKAIEQNKEDLALLEKQLAEKEQMLKTEREALNVSNDKVNASNEELKSLQQQESVEQAKIDKAKQVKVEKEAVAQISDEEYNNAKETVATLQQQLIELKKLERANKKEKEKIESKVGDSREQEAKVRQLETEYKDVQKAIVDTESAIESLTAKLAKQAEEAKETTYEIQRVTEETKKNQSQMSNALTPHESPRQESSGASGGSKGGSKGDSTKDGYRRDFAEELEYQQRSLALTIRQIEYKRNYSEIGEEVLNNIKAQVNALGVGTNSIKELRDRARDVNLEIKEAKFDLGIVDEDIRAFELLQESVQTQKQVYLNKLDTYEIGKLIAHTDSESLENIRQMVYALDDTVSSAEDLKRATQAINQSWTNMEHEAKVAKKFDDDWKQAIKYNEQLDRMTERERELRKRVVEKNKTVSIELQQRHKQIELSGILNHLTEEQAERWRELGGRLTICADSMQEVTSKQKALNQEMNQFKIDAMVNKLQTQESIFSKLGASLKSLPAQYIGLNEAVQLVERSFQGAFERVKELDSAYTNISMTMDVSKQAFETMRKTSVELGKQYGVMSGDVLDMMKIYASAGTTAEEINAQMAGTIAMKNVTGMDSEAVTNSIQTILQQYKLLEDGTMSSAQAIQYAGDVMTSVSYNLAKEEADAMKEVVSAVETAGSVIYQAGGSLEWYTAVTGTLTELMNASGSEVGNAINFCGYL